jgi:membrane-bound serine protease (ClpP class)
MHAWTVLIIAVGVFLLFAAVTGVYSLTIDMQVATILLVIAVVAIVIGVWLIIAAARAQYVKVKTGKEALIGATGVAVTDLKPKGEIRVLGEFWQATTEKELILNGQTVEVIGMDGMFLLVKAIKEKA